MATPQQEQCNYSTGAHPVPLQNKPVLNEATQNRCRNEKRTHLCLAESSSYNRYCLTRIFPKCNCKALHAGLGLGSARLSVTQ